MTRNIDQVPHKPDSDNNQPDQGPHPERVRTDLGGDTPAYPDWQPDPLDVRPRNKNKLFALVALGSVGATAVVGAAAYFGAKGANDGEVNRSIGADASHSAPLVPGQEGISGDHELPPLDMYNTDITHEDYGRQLNVTLPYLQEHRAQSLKEASDELESRNRVNPLLPANMPTDKILYDAQMDQNNITADLWTISKETNITLAHNLLNAVFLNDPNNTNDAYDLVEKQLGNGKGEFLEPTTVIEASSPYTKGALGGVHVNGEPTYVVQLVSRTKESKVYEEVISLRSSQDGKSSKPVVVQTMQYDGSEWVQHPSQMSAGN